MGTVHCVLSGMRMGTLYYRIWGMGMGTLLSSVGNGNGDTIMGLYQHSVYTRAHTFNSIYDRIIHLHVACTVTACWGWG